MERLLNSFNHTFMTAGMALFACVLFISCCMIKELNTGIGLSRNSGFITSEKTLAYANDTKGMHSNENDWNNEQIANEYFDFDKYYLNSLLNIYDLSHLYTYIVLIVLLPLILMILLVKGWSIEVRKSRFLLFLVHFIHSKDGKKDAPYRSYIF